MPYPFDYKKTWTNNATYTAAILLFQDKKRISLLDSTVELSADLLDTGICNIEGVNRVAAHIQTGLADIFEDQEYWEINYTELAELFYGVFGHFGENDEIEGMIFISK